METHEIVSLTQYPKYYSTFNGNWLPTPRTSQLSFRLGMATNIGGLRENQDASFIWRHKQSESLVFAVIDGHGSDYGGFAAHQIRLGLLDWLEPNFFEVFEKPAKSIRDLFAFAHERLFKTFQTHLKYQGFEIKIKDGYLLKSRGKSDWHNVIGGATVSVVMILQNGSKMYTANVGDCTGILSVNGRSLSRQMLKPLYVQQELEELKFTDEDLNVMPTNALEITWDHGPQCPREFRRMRIQRPSKEDPQLPYLTAVYPNVFTVDSDGNPAITKNGQIWKNVRKEWAARIVTPRNSEVQESLAVTRALGDFPMQSCGLTSVPDVFEVDISNVLDECAPVGGESSSNFGVIILGSDGIWDNWTFEQVSNFFINPDRAEKAFRVGSGEEQIEEFMQLNLQKGKRNFGGDADNATGIVCYFKREE